MKQTSFDRIPAFVVQRQLIWLSRYISDHRVMRTSREMRESTLDLLHELCRELEDALISE